MTHEHRPEHDHEPQERVRRHRSPLEELLNHALLVAELAEADLPHVVIAEIGPHGEQVLLGPCRSGLDALLASHPLEQELRKEFPDRAVCVRIAPLHPATSWPAAVASAVTPTDPTTR